MVWKNNKDIFITKKVKKSWWRTARQWYRYWWFAMMICYDERSNITDCPSVWVYIWSLVEGLWPFHIDWQGQLTGLSIKMSSFLSMRAWSTSRDERRVHSQPCILSAFQSKLLFPFLIVSLFKKQFNSFHLDIWRCLSRYINHIMIIDLKLH